MANVSEIITLGIGTPSSIPYLVLTGLGVGAAPSVPAPVGAPRWPLALHLLERPTGALLYTFPSPQGVTLTENEHGFESLTGFQPMLAHEAFWLYDLAPAKWVLLTCGGFPVWEGRLEDRKLDRGGFGFTAFGAKRALDDAPYTGLWSTKSFAGIRPVTGDELAKAAPERWALDNNNRFWFGLVDGETYEDDDHYGVQVFRHPHKASTLILEVDFSFDYLLPTDWQVRLISYDEGFSGAVTEYTFTSAGSNSTGTTTVTLTGGKALITFQVRNNTGGNVTYAGATGAEYAKVTNLRIKGSTNAAIYADEIARALVAFASGLNAGQLSSATGLLQSPGVDLTDEVYEDMLPAEIMTYLAEKGDDQTPPRKWEWGVWEGQQVYFRPQGDGALHWYVDAETLTLDSTLESLVNQAYTLYQSANNRPQRTDVETDAGSVARYGLARRGVMTERTTSATKAETARDTFLSTHKEIAPRASLTLFGLFDAGGARYPLWMARAGDTLTIRNLPPTLSPEIDKIRTFRMSRVSYNVDTDVLTPTPEYPLPTLAIQVANLSGPVSTRVNMQFSGSGLRPPDVA
jgi:hypothetical protein